MFFFLFVYIYEFEVMFEFDLYRKIYVNSFEIGYSILLFLSGLFTTCYNVLESYTLRSN